MEEVKVIIKNKEVKGFIIEEIDGYYKIGTYLGIIHRRKEVIDKKMAKKETFEKLKIELTEKNERIFREMYQFVKPNKYTTSFEKFINNWIENTLYHAGFE